MSNIIDITETTPQRARRLAKDYTDRFHERWNPEGKKWLKLAFVRGYQAACNDLASEAEGIDAAVAQWELDGDAEALATAVDTWLVAIFERAPQAEEVAA